MTQFPGIVSFVEKWGGVGPLMCIFPGGLLAGIALLWASVHWASSPGWASTEGQVVNSSINRSTRTINRPGGRPDRTAVSYSANIAYRYQVNGRDYTGHGIGDGVDWNYGSHESAAAALAPYLQGRVTVYYDPSDPSRAALDTNIFGIVPLVLGIPGLLLLGFGLWWRWRRLGRARDIG